MRTTALREFISRCYVLILFRLSHDADNFMQSLKCGMLPLLLGATKNTGAMPMMQWRNFGKLSALPNFTAPHIRSLITDMLQWCRVIDNYSATNLISAKF
jgi:hypothetical protein